MILLDYTALSVLLITEYYHWLEQRFRGLLTVLTPDILLQPIIEFIELGEVQISSKYKSQVNGITTEYKRIVHKHEGRTNL